MRLKSTCVTAPEVTEGPYYINNEYYRTDLRETQKGVNLVLDIGIMDTRTCTPLPAALVELWHCNASRFRFTTSGSLSDKFTWLRGGSETNANGVVELTTIYPGFYTGRTIHIHTMVHTSWTKSANGTIVSHSGSLRHIVTNPKFPKQLFFQETLNDQVVALSPYTSTTQRRTLNSGDGIYAQQNSKGFNGVVATELLGSTVSAGVLYGRGVSAIGVDTQASYSINTKNYYTP
ncbi:aromatic compound dioxygenase [Ceratobasidium sp. AG-I]|nr:aromatic compound dioxygenase [Ceratobasidium sp. AG-I]